MHIKQKILFFFEMNESILEKQFLILLLIIFLPLSSKFSQEKEEITLAGFVSDKTTGEVLVGTNILLYKDSISVETSPPLGAATNTFGYYAIPNLKLGHYILVARHIGYNTYIEEIEIEKYNLRINIQLHSQEIELGEIVVKNRKKDEPGISTINVDPELLDRLPSFSGEAELFKALELLPGIKTANEISSGLYVRGGSPDQTLVLVDGTIMYNPAHLGNFSSTFNSDAIQSIKLIKGAFPAQYGGRLSSVLDVRLRSGTKEREKGNIAFGSISSRVAVEGPLGDNATYMISGRKMYYDVLQKNFFEDSITPLYNFYDLNTKISYNISDSDLLWIEGILSRDKLYNPTASGNINYNIEWENNAVTLNWFKIGSNSIFLNNSISYVDYRFRSILEDNSNNSSGSDYFSSSILRDFFLKSNAEIHFRENHIVKMGAELAIHNYNLIYNDFYNETLEKKMNSDQGILSAEAALYFENSWRIFPKLETNLGLRFYYFKDQEYFRLEPRLSASYIVNENLHLNAAFAIAHQFLHLIVRNDISLPTDLWYPASKKINPGRSHQYVLGLDSFFDDKEYELSLEGYYKKLENLYEFKNGAALTPGKSIEDLLTKGQGEAYGVELFFNKRKGDLTGWMGYTLSWTKRKFDDLNSGQIFYPRYDRRHDISIVASYKLSENFSIGASWTYATGKGYTVPTGKYQFQNIGFDQSTNIQIDYTERNAYRLPSYHKLDLNAAYKFNWMGYRCKTYLNLLNVYNRQNPFAYYVESEENETVLNQITLFPFLPTVGLSINF